MEVRQDQKKADDRQGVLNPPVFDHRQGLTPRELNHLEDFILVQILGAG